MSEATAPETGEPTIPLDAETVTAPAPEVLAPAAPKPRSQMDPTERLIHQRDRARERADDLEGRFSQMEKQVKVLSSDLLGRDTKIAEFEQRETARVKTERETALLERVATKTGVSNRVLLRGLLGQLAGVDTAPEEVTDALVDDVSKAIAQAAPEVFRAQPSGGSPGQPGFNPNTKAEGQAPSTGDPRIDAVVAAAKRHSSVMTPSWKDIEAEGKRR